MRFFALLVPLALGAPAAAGPPPWAPAYGHPDRAAYRDDRRAYDRGFRDGARAARHDDRWDARRDRRYAYIEGYRSGYRYGAWDDGRRYWRDGRAYYWRDGRYVHDRRYRNERDYCRDIDRGNGGLVAGGLLGGVVGNRIARDDRAIGTIVGATAGGLIGRAIDRRDGNC